VCFNYRYVNNTFLQNFLKNRIFDVSQWKRNSWPKFRVQYNNKLLENGIQHRVRRILLPDGIVIRRHPVLLWSESMQRDIGNF